MKRFVGCSLIIVLMLFFAGCSRTQGPKPAATSAKIKVIASVFPVYDFVRQVGGDKVEVAMLVPPGAEPHDWEPSAKDLVRMKSAKAVFFHGADFESWVGKLLTKENLGDTPAIEVSAGIPRQQLNEGEAEHPHTDGHDHASTDPHIWLDPILAQQEVRNIALALCALDPANQEYYNSNAAQYIAELEKLHAEYQAGLKDAKQRSFITNHAAFGYLAVRYNLTQLPIMGLSPEAEPTPERMAKLVKLVKETGIRYIFAETVVSSKVANTIARETGAGILLLHPVDQLTESEWKQGETYLSLMRVNLANLKKATAE